MIRLTNITIHNKLSFLAKAILSPLLISAALSATLSTPLGAHEHTPPNTNAKVGISPWGKDDEIGRLNLMTAESRSAILANADWKQVFDLSVDYFLGMPSWQAVGDPEYQIWLTHTPRGVTVDDPLNVGDEINHHVSYTGAAMSMYTHMGTHIDALNHFGIDGKIWNGFSADEHLGDRGWHRAGAEKIPPIIARGVMLDIPALKGKNMLDDSYRITKQDIIDSLARQKMQLKTGDVVLVRTGRMAIFDDAQAYMKNSPGLGIHAIKYLVEEGGAMIIGADNLSLEAFPSEVKGNYIPIHTYLLAEKGVPIIELINLEKLAENKIYQFAFIGGSLKLRGADAAPMRPIAVPLK